MKKKVLVCLCFCICFFLFSQSESRKSFQVGQAYVEVKQYAQAIEYFKRSWSSRPETATAQKIAKTYYQLRDYESAFFWQKKVINKVDKEEDKQFLLTILLANSDYVKLDKYLKEFSGDSEEIWYQTKKQKLDTIQSWKLEATGAIKELKIVNTSSSEISPVLNDQGLVFSSNRENAIIKKKDGKTGDSFFNLYLSEGYRHSMSKPKPLSAMLNSKGHEGSVCFSDDNLDIYFTRIESNQNNKEEHDGVNKMKLFRSRKEWDLWQKPTQFLMNDSLYSFGQPYISTDGEFFFFSSDLPGGYGGSDIYVSKRLDSINWSDPVNLGATINTSGNEMNPYFDEDNTFFFSSNGYFTLGGYDLFSSELTEGEWAVPENLKYPINSSGDDFSIYWLDKNRAYICSNRVGGSGLEDIYYFVKRID